MTEIDRTPEASWSDAPRSSLDTRTFLVLVVLAGVGFGMTAPLTVLYAAGFGASDVMAGVAVSSIGVSLLLIDLFGTRLVPRVDGRFMMWFSLAMFGLGSVGSAAATELWHMIAARVFQGVGGAFFMGGALQLVVRFAPEGGAGRAIGSFNACWFGGVAVGPIVGGWLASHGSGQDGYRLAFLVCGLVCFAVAILGRVLLPPIPSGQSPHVSVPRRPEAVPGLRLWPALGLATVGQITRAGLVFTVLPLYGERELGLSTVAVGVAQSLLALVDLAAMQYGGALADRIGRRRVLLGALASGSVVCLGGLLVSGAAFPVWGASLGVVVGVMWVVPVAVVVDVSSEAEDGLSAYRIAADVGQLTGSTGAGALLGAGGVAGTLVTFAGCFALLAAWVARLPEVSRSCVARARGVD